MRSRCSTNEPWPLTPGLVAATWALNAPRKMPRCRKIQCLRTTSENSSSSSLDDLAVSLWVARHREISQEALLEPGTMPGRVPLWPGSCQPQWHLQQKGDSRINSFETPAWVSPRGFRVPPGEWARSSALQCSESYSKRQRPSSWFPCLVVYKEHSFHSRTSCLNILRC